MRGEGPDCARSTEEILKIDMERHDEPEPAGGRKEPLTDPPPNPKGGRTLIVDARDPHAYIRPSAALKEAVTRDSSSRETKSEMVACSLSQAMESLPL